MEERNMKMLGKYINGNYTIKIYEDGTKIRETEDDVFISSFPESIDLKITNKCNMGCLYCHEDSNIDGKHGDVLNTKFLDTLKPYTELALGGGNILEHPDLPELLRNLKFRNILANITLNQKHFMENRKLVEFLVKHNLIRGLGVSLVSPTNEFITAIKQYPNAVIHVINGVVTLEELKKLYDNNLKVLILGYKEFRRGKNFYSKEVEDNKQIIYDNISDIIKGFKVVSFDNLAIKQLELKRIFSNKDWNEFYMGDDGQFTMYIDLVNKKFARNSISETKYDLLDDITDIFNVVKSN